LAHRCGVFQVRNSKLEDLSILAEGSEINAAEETQNPFADLNLRESEELQEIKRFKHKPFDAEFQRMEFLLSEPLSLVRSRTIETLAGYAHFEATKRSGD
jgi:hypothetical protein